MGSPGPTDVEMTHYRCKRAISIRAVAPLKEHSKRAPGT